MSLQTRLSALITAIGADIKSLGTRVTTLENAPGGGGGVTEIHNGSGAPQTLLANSENTINGSAIAIPTGKIKAGTKYTCRIDIQKTAAGVAAPVVNVRIGTTAGNGDTSRGLLTLSAQTAVADDGLLEIESTFRSSGASTVLQNIGRLWHRLVTTGLSVTAVFTVFRNTSGVFDSTGAGLFIHVTLNPGASAAWTVNETTSKLENLTP